MPTSQRSRFEDGDNSNFSDVATSMTSDRTPKVGLNPSGTPTESIGKMKRKLPEVPSTRRGSTEGERATRTDIALQDAVGSERTRLKNKKATAIDNGHRTSWYYQYLFILRGLHILQSLSFGNILDPTQICRHLSSILTHRIVFLELLRRDEEEAGDHCEHRRESG
jgi:hypothetical protein